ncbi:hypothetical protein T07_2794 [Trichinella nelsoni]|uniref:PiggyBac transposable element-derived protein 4 C-terminal zinc-ribbon domain-containing protein n=1 Tax=Trichinella nelsoni TaxID=6336 RepID=A0A0V0SM87_9BILA|nr:hypothetical protein T07_2794 [Trichinella nelsoni]
MKLQTLKKQLRNRIILFERWISDIRKFCTESDVSKIRSSMNELEGIYADMSSLKREIEEFLTEEENDNSEIEAWHELEETMVEIRCLAEETLNGRAENTPVLLSCAVRNAAISLRRNTTAKDPASEKMNKTVRRRCAFCGRKKDRKVSTCCSKCKVPCCCDHMYIFCESCCNEPTNAVGEYRSSTAYAIKRYLQKNHTGKKCPNTNGDSCCHRLLNIEQSKNTTNHDEYSRFFARVDILIGMGYFYGFVLDEVKEDHLRNQ